VDSLFDIPVLGLIFQLVAYSVLVVTSNSTIILALATPIALGAMCGMMNERSGVVNIGIEGMMLASAFTGWYVASLVGQAGQADPSFFFGATPAIVIGVLAALLTGLLFSAVHAWLSISVRADQIISGTIINIVAFGVTGYLNILISKHSPDTGGKFVPFAPPEALVDIPVVGWIFQMFLQQGPITMSVIVLAIVLQILLLRSRWGLRTRAVGEHPEAAETVGIDVIRLRYRNVILGGLFAGLAGAWFTLDYGNSFQPGMTNGRGFIALAALIFGSWRPVPTMLACLFFGIADALSIQMQGVSRVPVQFVQIVPYVLTVIVVAGFIGKARPPRALGVPYGKP
jgi:general nucleoside transport system permease protein